MCTFVEMIHNACGESKHTCTGKKGCVGCWKHEQDAWEQYVAVYMRLIDMEKGARHEDGTNACTGTTCSAGHYNPYTCLNC